MVLITEIEGPICPKAFLGGYRNRKTNREYLNAASQTAPRCVARVDAQTRETQYVDKTEAGTQSISHHGTQTWR